MLFHLVFNFCVHTFIFSRHQSKYYLWYNFSSVYQKLITHKNMEGISEIRECFVKLTRLSAHGENQKHNYK